MNKLEKIIISIAVVFALLIASSAYYKVNCDTQSKELGSSYAPFTSFTSFVSTTVGTSSVQVLGADVSREYALFTNDSDTAIYLNFSSASSTVANYVVRLNATGGTYEMSADTGNLYSGPVYASSTAASKIMKTLVK